MPSGGAKRVLVVSDSRDPHHPAFSLFFSFIFFSFSALSLGFPQNDAVDHDSGADGKKRKSLASYTGGGRFSFRISGVPMVSEKYKALYLNKISNPRF